MAYKTVFKRYEPKYILTSEQKERVVAAMSDHMAPEDYGRTTVRNIYYDTDSYLLVRRSIEKPTYKEKLRLRSYRQASPDGTVFVELKKKYRSVVYKRRISLPEREAADWVAGNAHCKAHTQISNEVDYFLEHYETLHPALFLSYERESYSSRDGGNLRVTFDDTVLCRQEELSLEAEVYGTPILPPDTVIMEIKCSGGIPLWMTEILSREHIRKTSFSKYGTAYKTLIFPLLCGANKFTSEVAVNA